MLSPGMLPITGTVTYYGYGDGYRGTRTASGERFDPKAMTAAALGLPFGFRLKLTNPDNRKSVIVRVNDRGPYEVILARDSRGHMRTKPVPSHSLLIMISYGAGLALGMGRGYDLVKLRVERA